MFDGPALRDDLELMLKSELLGRLTHFETSMTKSSKGCRNASPPLKPEIVADLWSRLLRDRIAR